MVDPLSSPFHIAATLALEAVTITQFLGTQQAFVEALSVVTGAPIQYISVTYAGHRYVAENDNIISTAASSTSSHGDGDVSVLFVEAAIGAEDLQTAELYLGRLLDSAEDGTLAALLQRGGMELVMIGSEDSNGDPGRQTQRAAVVAAIGTPSGPVDGRRQSGGPSNGLPPAALYAIIGVSVALAIVAMLAALWCFITRTGASRRPQSGQSPLLMSSSQPSVSSAGPHAAPNSWSQPPMPPAATASSGGPGMKVGDGVSAGGVTTVGAAVRIEIAPVGRGGDFRRSSSMQRDSLEDGGKHRASAVGALPAPSAPLEVQDMLMSRFSTADSELGEVGGRYAEDARVVPVDPSHVPSLVVVGPFERTQSSVNDGIAYGNVQQTNTQARQLIVPSAGRPRSRQPGDPPLSPDDHEQRQHHQSAGSEKSEALFFDGPNAEDRPGVHSEFMPTGDRQTALPPGLSRGGPHLDPIPPHDQASFPPHPFVPPPPLLIGSETPASEHREGASVAGRSRHYNDSPSEQVRASLAAPRPPRRPPSVPSMGVRQPRTVSSREQHSTNISLPSDSSAIPVCQNDQEPVPLSTGRRSNSSTSSGSHRSR